jgi:hypothetical protein
MKERTKVILHGRDDWGDDVKMSLTDDQIRLLNYLYDNDIINPDEWDIQTLDKAEKWVEV